MKLARIICLLVISVLAVCPLGSVWAQEEEPEPVLISAETSDYTLSFIPRDERYDTVIVAGSDRIITFTLENEGTGTIDNITFDSNEPEDWEVEFDPKRVASLEAGESE